MAEDCHKLTFAYLQPFALDWNVMSIFYLLNAVLRQYYFFLTENIMVLLFSKKMITKGFLKTFDFIKENYALKI